MSLSPVDTIAVRAMRSGAQAAGTYMRDLAHAINTPELVVKVESPADEARVIAIARALAAARHCEDAAKEMQAVLEHIEATHG